MTYPIEDIDGLDENLRARLGDVGVRTTTQLLSRWLREPARIEALAAGHREDLRLLLSLSDLLRITGVGLAYAKLLHAAGIDGAGTLSGAAPAKVYDALEAVKARMTNVRRLSTLANLRAWIKDADGLPPLDH